MIRVFAPLHVVLVTTGAMDSSWAMAKSLGLSRPDAPALDLAPYGRPEQCALLHDPHREAGAHDLEGTSLHEPWFEGPPTTRSSKSTWSTISIMVPDIPAPDPARAHPSGYQGLSLPAASAAVAAASSYSGAAGQGVPSDGRPIRNGRWIGAYLHEANGDLIYRHDTAPGISNCQASAEGEAKDRREHLEGASAEGSNDIRLRNQRPDGSA